MEETRKNYGRRANEGFFQKYCQGKGIDIGSGSCPLQVLGIDTYDLPNDAKFMQEVKNEAYDFVYSSHCLEDIDEPDVAIQNWWRILKTGGYLILSVPHRDLFERKRSLPSHGNKNHKHFFLIDRYEYPCTIGLVPFITKNLSNQDIIYVKKCDDGYSCSIVEQEAFPLGIHVIASGELSIEAVIKKSEKVIYVEDFLRLRGNQK